MSLRSAPAALPALAAFLAFAFGVAAEPRPPVAGSAALAGLGLALGGALGNVVAAGAAGALAATSGSRQAPINDAELGAEVEGTICGRWHRRVEFDAATARFCPAWLRQGSRLLVEPPKLWISLPDAPPPPAYGTTLRARGNLSRFPGLANVPAVPPGPWRLRVKSTRLIQPIAPPGPIARVSSALRARIERALAEAGSPPGAGTELVRGLVLGDDDGLPEEVGRALRRCGLAHLLAVSGFNLTLAVALAALAAAAVARARSLVVPAVAIVLYLAAVGPEPSLVRAALMACAALGLVACGRAVSPLQALCLAWLGLAGADFGAISEPGLQLSCGATAGLLLFARRWSDAFRPLPRGLSLALAASVAAQLGALPASVAAFSEISLLAPWVNLLALPWAVAATTAAFGWTALALVDANAAGALRGGLDALAQPLFLLDRLPPSAWMSTPLQGGAVAGVAVAAVMAMTMESLAAGRRTPVALGIVLLCVAPSTPRGEEAMAIFADVGQGDAAVVNQGGTTLLVDGGGLVGRDVGTDALRPLLARLGIDRIDAAIVSHAHRDHCAGLAELSRHLVIEQVLIAPGSRGAPCIAELERRARRGTVALAAGQQWRLGAIVVHALAPRADTRLESVNGGSLVVRVDVAGRSVLFPGDLDGDDEIRLARTTPGDLASEILKVSHHGSAGSSAAAFLAAVGARWAVVSAGARNPFGHPAPETLSRLVASGARVARTDRDGMVVLRWRVGQPIRLELPASPRAEVPGNSSFFPRGAPR